MNSAEKEAVLHCLKSMIDEEVCEECPLYGTTGTDHCEKDCVRLAINALSSSEKPNKWISLDEKEPKDGQLILVTFVNMYDKRYVRIAEFREEVYRKYDGKIDQRYYGFHSVENIYSWGDKAVAWMPLSEPYKAEIPTGQIVANGELYPGEFDDPLAAEGSEE